jgi:organic radical activating enzyme
VYEETLYQVNEQFCTIQGEGYYTGTASTFIRLQGCTVGCVWCDSGPLADLVEGRMTNGETRNTWGKGGQRRSLGAIMAGVRTRHVVITGGEPTIWNLDPIIRACWDIGCVVQLETSGQNALKGALVPDWVTWSPKERLDYCPHDLLVPHIKEVKWVVDEALEWEEVWGWWEYFQSRQQPIFSLMPEGSPPKDDMVKKALLWMEYVPMKYQRDWIYSHRLQYVLNVR